ncbi:MAG: hypothetical protein LBD03_06655 [Methanobrevibacter sp.]|nr:hypothetical protein [Candidatus Methanovirga procula]
MKIISINQNINWKQIEGVHEYVLLKHPGDIVDPLLGVRSMIGFAYIKANTSSQCISIAKKIYSLFDIEYENI